MIDCDPRLLKFPQVLLVEASAGSGKTYTLAKRYIQLLISPYLKPEDISLNTILAITFTNKSAIEMKERILEFLKKIALDKFSNPEEKKDILFSLGVEEDAARNKSLKILDKIIRHYNFFQVQTIDSFINAILCGCAFKLDLSANFKTEKDYKEYLAYSLDKLIDRAAADKDTLRLFHNFLTQYLLIENKSGWFPKENILSAVGNLFFQTNKYTGQFRRSKVETEDLIRQKKNILKLAAELRQNLPEGTNAAFINSLAGFLEKNKEGFAVDNLSLYFNREEFPVNKGYKISAEVKRLWDGIRENLKELCEMESAFAFNYYVDIFVKVQDDLKIISSKDDVLFLEALNKEAHSLFDEKSLTLPELYYRLATRFKHFLIDEFQDTSNLQWDNLFLMVQEALATNGSLFYVGDKKQAIYRFRGGEVSLISRVKDHFKDFNLIEKSLVKNYRSQREIVEFNNLVFSKENINRFIDIKERDNKNFPAILYEEREEIIKIFEGSKQDYLADKNGGYLKVEFIDVKNKEERNRILRSKITALIDDLNKRFSSADIALLVRKNDEVELLTSWLLEQGFPVESEKTLDIKQNSYIKELVSFLKFLNSPIDNLSFASFILGEIFLSASGMNNGEVEDFIFSFNHGKKESLYLYREFRLKFPRAWEDLIEEFFKNAGIIPLYEFVVSIFAKFKVIDNFSAYQGFFMRFLEFIKEEEEENSTLASFLELFDKAEGDSLYVNVSQSEAIKVLTIHKSKGLEFPAVIIPFLEMNVKVDQEAVIVSLQTPQGGPGRKHKAKNKGAAADSKTCEAASCSELKLIRLKKRYTDFSPGLETLYRESYFKSFIDELNNIYVALTRAEEELYVFAAAKAETGSNLAALLLPEMDIEKGEKKPYSKDISTKADFLIEIPPAGYKDWIRLLKDEFGDKTVLEARANILRGDILHYILSFIGSLDGLDKGVVLKAAIGQAEKKYPFIDDFSSFEDTAARLIEANELRPYFYVAGAQVYLEKEIVDSFGNAKRIDRLIVKEEEILVIDYKTGREKDGIYHRQIEEYTRIMRDIYPEKPVKGILIYLDDLSCEEVQ